MIISFAAVAPLLNSRLRSVALTGAAIAPVVFYAACRRADRRGTVRAFMEAFQALGHRPP